MASKQNQAPAISMLSLAGLSHTNSGCFSGWHRPKTETPPADCHMPITPSSEAELPVIPSQKVASLEMSSKCALVSSWENTFNLTTCRTHSTCGWNLAWRQTYVTFTIIPSIVLGFVIAAKERCPVSSRSSTVKYEPTTSLIALTWVHQESLLSLIKGEIPTPNLVVEGVPSSIRSGCLLWAE